MRKFYSAVFPVLLQFLLPLLCVSYLFSFFQSLFFSSEKQLFFWGPWSEKKLYNSGCDMELALSYLLKDYIDGWEEIWNEEIYMIL